MWGLEGREVQPAVPRAYTCAHEDHEPTCQPCPQMSERAADPCLEPEIAVNSRNSWPESQLQAYFYHLFRLQKMSFLDRNLGSSCWRA